MADTNSSHYHQNISGPNDNELSEILDDYENGQNPRQSEEYRLERAKAALNAYFLSQALEIVGEDETVESGFASVKKAETPVQHVRNTFRSELRKAFQSKYAPKEGQ